MAEECRIDVNVYTWAITLLHKQGIYMYNMQSMLYIVHVHIYTLYMQYAIIISRIESRNINTIYVY